MKKKFLILVAIVFSLNSFAQPKFEKMYQGSDNIVSLGGDFFAVKKNSKWGVMKNTTLVLDFYYDSIDVLSDGIITFVKNNQVGFSDTLGNIISFANYPLETPYTRADEAPLNIFNNGSALVYFDKRLTLINKAGQEFLDEKFEIISKVNNTVIFKKDGAYGIMDANGNILAENKYRQIQTIIAGQLYAYTGRKDGFDYLGLINANGEVKSDAQYNDMIIINKGEKYFIKAFASTGKQALYSSDGDMIFQPLYQNIEPTEFENYYIVTDNTRKGIIGTDYKIYVPVQYDNIKMINIKQDTFFVAINDYFTYILDLNNNTIDKFNGNIKDIISYKNKELIYIADSLLNYGVRSNTKGWIIEPKYLDIFAMIGNNLVVRKDSKWGVIDMKDNIIIPFEYDKVRASHNKTNIVLYKGKRNSIMFKQDGTYVEFPKTDNVLPLDTYIEYKVKGERTRLYLDGRELKDDFKNIGSDKNGILCVQKKKGWTYVNNTTYDPLTEKYFDFVTGFNNGYAFVVNDKKLCIIDSNFNIIETLLDESYTDLNNTASLLSSIDKINKKTIIVKDKNNKKVLLKKVK